MTSKPLEYYLNLPYSIVLTPGDDEEEGWLAEIPDLPGCFAAGDTQIEALMELAEIQRLWIAHCLQEGLPIPEPHFHRVQLQGAAD